MTDTYVRTLVQIKNRSADLPEDATVHHVFHHHTDVGGVAGPFDPAGHALNVSNAFKHGTAGTGPFSCYSNRQITTKVYRMQDMKPRPVLATYVDTPVSWDTAALAPRETAVCLRYYAARNLVGQRGRLYIGPLTQTYAAAELVVLALANQLFDLAIALAAIGGANMSWVMHSDKQDILNAPGSPGGTTTAAYHDITECWVNDQWSHMESRERAEATRWTQAITPGIP